MTKTKNHIAKIGSWYVDKKTTQHNKMVYILFMRWDNWEYIDVVYIPNFNYMT